jgi:hypothetical protein
MPTSTPRKPALPLALARKCVNPALRAPPPLRLSKKAPRQPNQLRRVSKCQPINTHAACTKPGTVKAEKAAIANRDPARKKAAEKIMKREGTTNPGGGRSAAKMMAPKAKGGQKLNPCSKAQANAKGKGAASHPYNDDDEANANG